MKKIRQPSSPNAEEPARVLSGAGIRLHVASTDDLLIATCQEALQDLEAEEEPSGAAASGQPVQVVLWDFEPGVEIHLPERLGQRVFYVVPAVHLDQLRARFPEAEGSILLKPVTRAVLRAFLGSAARARAASEIGTLRANRDEMLQHLLQANLRLQEYDQQRTNFIARAVHDFRAPLTALSGFCGLLISGELGPLSEVQQDVLQRMQRSTARISSMASAMFELSAGPRMGLAPELREGDILEALRQAVHEIQPQAREKQVELRTDRITSLSRTWILMDSPLGTYQRENVQKENYHVAREESRFRGCGRSPEGD
jgi:signal transduction histidine kinase